MMRSMYSGVAGLKTHQVKMDVIGNNIANVNTVAYKSQSITFNELMYQTTQSASGPNALTGRGGVNARQIGLGVKVGGMSTAIGVQGASQSTGNAWDLKISGSAFFVVSDGNSNFFTRDGSFYVDGAGNLAMQSNGYNVMGWGVDETGNAIKQDTVAALKIMSEEYMTYDPEATTEAYVSGIIDRNSTEVNSKGGKILNLQFYDSLGYSYTAKLSVKSIGDASKTGEYSVELVDIKDAKNESVMSKFPNIALGKSTFVADPSTMKLPDTVLADLTQYTYKDATGTEVVVDIGTLQPIVTDPTAAGYNKELLEQLAKDYGFTSVDEFLNTTVDVGTVAAPDHKKVLELLAGGIAALSPGGAAGDEVVTSGRVIKGDTVKYDTSNGKFGGIGGQANNSSIKLSFPGYGNFKEINIDFSTTSMWDNKGSSTIAAEKGSLKKLGTGRKTGKLDGVTVQNNGMIYATYNNGMSRLLGQIACAEFPNPSGLEKRGDNLYGTSNNSGDFNGIGVDLTASGGSLSSGVLEMSNVDLSSEFTEMITTQRGFQANSRIITVSDTLLEELVNLKR